MNRIELIDIIRRELKRQANSKNILGMPYLYVTMHGTPDAFEVNGMLDIDALAKAIRDER
jgi:hypothetical protein